MQPLTGGRVSQGAHGDGAALRGHEGEQVAQAFPGDRDPRHWVRGGCMRPIWGMLRQRLARAAWA